MPRYAFLVSLAIAACSVELAEPDRSDPFKQIGGTTGSGGSGEEGGGGTFGGGSGSGATGAGGGVGGIGGDNDASTGDPCTDCNLAFCPEYTTCLNTAECAALSQCIASATTPSAQVNCYNTWVSAYDLYFATVSCQYLACGAACGWGQPCVDCEDTNCSAQKSACLSSDGCLGYWYCISLCSDAGCADQCDTYWGAAGFMDYDSYFGCSYSLCDAACG